MRLNRSLSIAAITLSSIYSAYATTIDTFTLTFNVPAPFQSYPNPAIYKFSQLVWQVQEPVFSLPDQPLPGYDTIIVDVPQADSNDPAPEGYVFPKGHVGGIEIGYFTQNPAPGAPSFEVGWPDSGIGYFFTETGPSITQGTLDDPTFAAGSYVFTSGTVSIDQRISLPPGQLNDLDVTTWGDTLTITKEDIPDTPEPSSLILLGTGFVAACVKFCRHPRT
jgi:PEP-CTERM motif